MIPLPSVGCLIRRYLAVYLLVCRVCWTGVCWAGKQHWDKPAVGLNNTLQDPCIVRIIVVNVNV